MLLLERDRTSSSVKKPKLNGGQAESVTSKSGSVVGKVHLRSAMVYEGHQEDIPYKVDLRYCRLGTPTIMIKEIQNLKHSESHSTRT